MDDDGLIGALDPDNTDGPTQDPDEDGLTNAEEEEQGTDPQDADSDDDGLTDGEEVNDHGTDPLDPNTDGDGYTDGEEIAEGWDPLDPEDPDLDACNCESSIGGGSSSLLGLGLLALLGVVRRRL